MQSHEPNYFLSSKRICFRPWQKDDLPLALALWGDRQVTRLFYKEPLSQEQVSERLHLEIAGEAAHHIQYWPIFRREDGAHLGCAGLRPASTSRLEFGVHLRPQFWGQGYATEAGAAVISYAFQNNLCDSLFAGHHPDNRASRNTLLKLGFLGSTATYYQPTGLLHPSYLLYKSKPPFTVRAARKEDGKALAIVHCQSIEATFRTSLPQYVEARSLEHCERSWQERLDVNIENTVVLCAGEQIVGFAGVGPCPDSPPESRTGLLERIYIHPSAWGRGQGRILLDWCQNRLRALGYTSLRLWVFEVNTRARDFYSRQGFGLDPERKADFQSPILSYSKSI